MIIGRQQCASGFPDTWNPLSGDEVLNQVDAFSIQHVLAVQWIKPV